MNDEQLKVVIETEIPESFKPQLDKIQDRVNNLRRTSERGIINEKSGAAVIVRDDGQVNLSSNEYASYKINPNGRTIEHSLESQTVTNRKKINADEIIVNDHKLNHNLYELTDFKQGIDDGASAVGNFCVMGTVLVKCWEPNLKRYVLIRRQVRMPMFSPLLNVPEIPEALHISDPLQATQDMQVAMDGGYQVNSKISDAKSNIKNPGNQPKPTENAENKATEVKD